MKQELLAKIHQGIRGLAQLRKNGYKVGRLKFKRYLSSISLKQYGNSYRLFPDQQKIRIQGLCSLLRILGLDQIPATAEFADAYLLRRHGDYYLHVVTYRPKENLHRPPRQAIGLDFGLSQQITFSNGVVLKYQISFPKRLRWLYRRFSKTKKGSKNSQKVLRQLVKAFEKHTNQKKQIRNHVVGYLKWHYEMVCFQNDPFPAWQRLLGKKMLNLLLGAMKQILNEQICSPIEVPLSFASTQLCSGCGSKQKLNLDDRLYQCSSCGLIIDRDLNAAFNIEQEGLHLLGMESLEVMPAEIESSTQEMLSFFRMLPFVSANSVKEPGNLSGGS